jgi:hypothetical protein
VNFIADARKVAFHELGHAVAALLCGEQVVAVHLALAGEHAFSDWHNRQDCQCHGLCETGLRPFSHDVARRLLDQDPDRWWSKLWARSVNFVFFCAAGPIAEAKSQGVELNSIALTRTDALQADFARAADCLVPFEEDSQERLRMAWRLWEASAAIIAQPRIWQAICITAPLLTPQPGEPARLLGSDLQVRVRAYLPDLPQEPISRVIPALKRAADEL